MIEIEQYINRESQEGRLLLNGPSYKKWTTKVAKVSSSLYTVISDERKGAVIITDNSNANSGLKTMIIFDIISLPMSHAKQNTSMRKVGASKMENRLKVFMWNTVVMRATPTGIQVEMQDEGSPETLKFTEPFPWLVTITCGSNTTVQTV
jgi:hypothetical protein